MREGGRNETGPKIELHVVEHMESRLRVLGDVAVAGETRDERERAIVAEQLAACAQAGSSFVRTRAGNAVQGPGRSKGGRAGSWSVGHSRGMSLLVEEWGGLVPIRQVAIGAGRGP